MKIALLGGSFNPVHKGHIALAESAVKLAGYDRVVFVPAYQSPFKSRCSKGVVSSPEEAGAFALSFTDEERIEMLRLAIKPYPWAALELCEIERAGVSYTIDTVRFLTEKYKREGLLEGKLGIIIGADLIEGFHRWKEADALADEADIILARRPYALKADFAYPHVSIMNELFDISSTEVRRRIACHEEISALIPDEICRYIEQRGVYDS
ncbi:MAG: nicotinate (nicotinamide) nucleotide adenylyltransferase [Treponema sp.]|nr:nicotinate (nicotinamide) nucleotide adenylyltransferase [Candidatus Treponema caballi]